MNADKNLKFCLGRMENIVGSGENAGYQHILLFPLCFQGSFKVGLCGKELIYIEKKTTCRKRRKYYFPAFSPFPTACLGGLVVSVSDSGPGGYEFNTQLR